jgi:hypothetical protein
VSELETMLNDFQKGKSTNLVEGKPNHDIFVHKKGIPRQNVQDVFYQNDTDVEDFNSDLEINSNSFQITPQNIKNIKENHFQFAPGLESPKENNERDKTEELSDKSSDRSSDKSSEEFSHLASRLKDIQLSNSLSIDTKKTTESEDIFANISSDDDSIKEENEKVIVDLSDFNITPDLLEQYSTCEFDFKKSLGGWNSIKYYEKDPYAYLYYIRTMSIDWIIAQARLLRSNSLGSFSNADSPTEERKNVSKSQSMVEKEHSKLTTLQKDTLKKFQEADDEWDL